MTPLLSRHLSLTPEGRLRCGSRCLGIEVQSPTCQSRTESTSLPASSPVQVQCGSFRQFARATAVGSEAPFHAGSDILLLSSQLVGALFRGSRRREHRLGPRAYSTRVKRRHGNLSRISSVSPAAATALQIWAVAQGLVC
jgi:hypothetical protein